MAFEMLADFQSLDTSLAWNVLKIALHGQTPRFCLQVPCIRISMQQSGFRSSNEVAALEKPAFVWVAGGPHTYLPQETEALCCPDLSRAPQPARILKNDAGFVPSAR